MRRGGLAGAACFVAVLICGCPDTQPAGNDDNNDNNDDNSVDATTDVEPECRCLEDLQVTVEVRFIATTDDFFERIGIDFDVELPLTSADPSGASYGPGLFNTPAASFVSANNQTDFVVDPLPPPPTDPAAGTSLLGAFLDDTQLEVILRAVGDGDTLLDAPPVTTNFGDVVFSIIGNENLQPTNLDVDFNDALIEIDSLIRNVFAGPSLEIVPRVNEDRAIRLDVIPTLGTLFFTPDPEWRPQVRSSTVRTTISMTDGQTLVLGGVIAADGMQTKGTVPVIGRVPVLSRSFDTRQAVTDETTLFVLITAEIVDPG